MCKTQVYTSSEHLQLSPIVWILNSLLKLLKTYSSIYETYAKPREGITKYHKYFLTVKKTK